MQLITYPNKLLATKCPPVLVTGKDDAEVGFFTDDVSFDEDLTDLLLFMLRTLEETSGIGLAANQVGMSKRVFMMKRFYTVKGEGANSGYTFEPRDEYVTCVNPVILDRSKELMLFDEGCLSFPGKTVRTRRPGAIKVAYYNDKGQSVCEVLDGLESIIFQHELDHLNGKDMRDREFSGRAN